MHKNGKWQKQCALENQYCSNYPENTSRAKLHVNIYICIYIFAPIKYKNIFTYVYSWPTVLKYLSNNKYFLHSFDTPLFIIY